MSKVYAVGLGPGDEQFMTREAEETLGKVDVIAGYTVYVDLVRDRFDDKEFYTTGMKQEIERCRWAIEKAVSGKEVAMVCSGDAGIYGMAGCGGGSHPRHNRGHIGSSGAGSASGT